MTRRGCHHSANRGRHTSRPVKLRQTRIANRGLRENAVTKEEEEAEEEEAEEEMKRKKGGRKEAQSGGEGRRRPNRRQPLLQRNIYKPKHPTSGMWCRAFPTGGSRPANWGSNLLRRDSEFR